MTAGTAMTAADFDALHAREDPFGYRTRWYERRKRALLVSSLPRPSYANAWEIGCSNGELSRSLASRCDRLLATDVSERAIAAARARNPDLPHVRFVRAHHPAELPDGAPFDLVVLSEVGYYLPARDLQRLAEFVARALAPDATVVGCHWRTPFAGATLSAAEVHAALALAMGADPAYRYEDADFLLEGWTGQPSSVAEREGLR